MSKSNILLIDDEELCSNLYKELLESKGFKVDVAQDGAEALKKLKVKKPDLILLDLVMPNMNGFDFLNVMKKQKNLSDVPVIVLSNLSQEIDKEQCKLFNIRKFLVKVEVTTDEIVESVKEVLK
ncbi:MAG: response regulator [Candidatus Uhrbacteria bacterium]